MKIVFDVKLKRPGCALLQAAYGGTPGIHRYFPVETWLLAPTPDMAAYEATPEQLEKLVTMSKLAVV